VGNREFTIYISETNIQLTVGAGEVGIETIEIKENLETHVEVFCPSQLCQGSIQIY
jgi:hypothetical protein